MRLIFFFAILLQSTHSLAVDPHLSLQVGEADVRLQKLEKAFDNPADHVELSRLYEFQKDGLFVKKTANECIEINEGAINKAADDLDLLGVQTLKEGADVLRKRQSLNQTMLGHAQQLASCRLLLLRAHELVAITLTRQELAIASELWAKKSNLYENFKNILLNPAHFFNATIKFIQTDSGLTDAWNNSYILFGLLLLSVVMILFLKRRLKSSLRRHEMVAQKGYLSQFQLALISCASRHMPPLILMGIMSLYYLYRLIVENRLDFLGLMVFGLFLYVIINLFIRILLNPCPPGNRLTKLPEDISLLLARRLRLLSKILLVGFLMYSALQIHDFPSPITSLLRNVYLFLLVLNIIWAVWLLRFYEGVSNNLFLRTIIIFGLLFCLAVDWVGYRNLADFVLLGITGSILIWAITIFLLRIWTDFLDSMDEGRHEWQQRMRKRIGVRGNDFLPGSFWFRFTFAIVIWSVFAVLILKIWGLPEANLIALQENVTRGFEIGAVRVVPIKVLLAILTFAILLSIIGWVKRRMDKSWLNRSRMERGSKEAMISLTGYSGVAIAFLIALSMAGFELANIALIAGALSVGIGFGLQNIVNNFISGVILLFERPVKTGDWIVVGGTEGYVKKISIRSTQIQTFDRSDVIVPNSELISGQVTNWMFRDSIGRVIVPVGVAYGSDPERIREILLEIAHNNPSVITNSPILSKPWVVFREFGDSSLNFELRCFIKTVDERLKILSDINFEIERAFRKANIEIPFPQRDVHLINSTGSN